MAKPPDQTPYSPSPLNVKRYNPVLEAPDIPSFEAAMDHTAGVTGFGAGSAAEDRDLLADLTEEAQIRLLRDNNIRPVAMTGADAKPLWEMTAFVVRSDLVSARKGAVR